MLWRYLLITNPFNPRPVKSLHPTPSHTIMHFLQHVQLQQGGSSLLTIDMMRISANVANVPKIKYAFRIF